MRWKLGNINQSLLIRTNLAGNKVLTMKAYRKVFPFYVRWTPCPFYHNKIFMYMTCEVHYLNPHSSINIIPDTQ